MKFWIVAKAVLTIVIAIYAANSAAANSVEPLQKNSKPKQLVLGVEDVPYYPYFDFLNEQDTFTKELFNKFGELYGYQFVYLPMPVKRFGMWLFEQDIDLKFPDNARWNESDEVDRLTAESLSYSKEVVRLLAGTVTRDPKAVAKSDIKIFGTLLGFHPTLWVDEINSGNVELYENSSTLMLMQQLLHGNLDAVDLDISVVNHYLGRLGKPAMTLNKSFKYESYAYHLSTIKHPDVITDFDDFLTKNKAFVEGLKKKYKTSYYMASSANNSNMKDTQAAASSQ